MNWKDVAVSRMALTLAISILQDLHFHASMKRYTFGCNVISPDKDPRIAARDHMSPFHFHDEVLVHLFGANLADWFASALEHSVFEAPGFRRSIRQHPAIEIFAIEQGLEVVIGRQQIMIRSQKSHRETGKDEMFQHRHESTPREGLSRRNVELRAALKDYSRRQNMPARQTDLLVLGQALEMSIHPCFCIKAGLRRRIATSVNRGKLIRPTACGNDKEHVLSDFQR